ncbi:MAG: hypothetical protein KDD55_03635 [Bdellovibrionales bacterium]|nr:hypothetical protein [Bdellovibrionales bacterium]
MIRSASLGLLLFVFFISLVHAQSQRGDVSSSPSQGHWLDSASGVLSVTGPIKPEFVQQCVQGGLDVEYRFLMQSCERRGSWFDSCSRTRKQIHKMSFDPVREAYRLVVDRLGDIEGPQVFHFSDLNRAIARMSSIPDLPADYFSQSTEKSLREKTGYLSVRNITICKGEYSAFVSHLSYLFSFGFLYLVEEDSDWYDLPIENSQTFSNEPSHSMNP